MTNQSEDLLKEEGTRKVDPALHEDASKDCIFCHIAKGTVPAVKLYEDSETVAFLDINPVHPGHVLVIPKDHYENVYSTPAEAWLRMMMTVQKMAVAVKNATDADGINIEMNNESAAGQVMFHAHVHIIPRFNEDGLKHWPSKAYKDHEEMQAVSEKIIAELK
ncbi:MAG TPA: HIT family protein [Candidatus Paceibacterota bacterium]